MTYDNSITMRNMGSDSITPQVCCTETKTTGCTSCGTNPKEKGSETRNELLNFKMLRPIDHLLNVVIIVSVVSVAVLISLLIFKKR